MSRHVVVDLDELLPILDQLNSTHRLRGYGKTLLVEFLTSETVSVEKVPRICAEGDDVWDEVQS